MYLKKHGVHEMLMFVPTVAMQAGESNTHADQFILHSRQEMEEKHAQNNLPAFYSFPTG